MMDATKTGRWSGKDENKPNIPSSMGMHVVITGNPIDGLEIYGPFKTHNHAIEWAAKQKDLEDWWVAPLVSPDKGY